MKKIIIVLMLLPMLFSACTAFVSEDDSVEFRRAIDELDALIGRRREFIARREAYIDSLKQGLREEALSPQMRYELTEELIDCYISYQSDSTIVYLKRNQELAQQLGDDHLMARARSSMAFCYSLNGRFLEAEMMLDKIKDTLDLDRRTLRGYYIAQHRKNRELCSQIKSGAQYELFRGRERYYAEQTAAICDDSVMCYYYQYMNADSRGDRIGAMHFCDRILQLSSPDSHDYAKAANHKSVMEGLLGHEDQKNSWLVRSAMADLQAAVRDYGSLGAISEVLLAKGDVERAMHYIRLAINDTHFFNSPIRAWRDMIVLPQIEQAYNQRNDRLRSMYVVLMVVVMLFGVSAVAGGVFVLRQNRRLNVVQQTLRESNAKLNELMCNLRQTNDCLSRQNIHIVDANRIKEVYIGGFLKTISEYINKLADTHRYVCKMLRNDKGAELLRECTRMNVRNDELKEFYTLFDTTFLELYPSFVDEFNELLNDRPHTASRREGSLTTELRIYALIRLGITDTTTIAGLLQCSVNTVYNYRSRMRLLARDSSRDLEQQVLIIGIDSASLEPNNSHKAS